MIYDSDDDDGDDKEDSVVVDVDGSEVDRKQTRRAVRWILE